jgi:CRP-like cAMP-binding protein
MAAELSRISLFQGLKPEDLGTLASRTTVRSLAADELLVREGERAEALFAILRGKVKVFLNDTHGNEVVLDVRSAGQYVGEMMLDEKPRSASVKALEPCEIAVIPGEDFRALVMRDPQIALQIIHNLIRLARGANVRTIEDVRTRTELQLYIEQLKRAKAEDLPSVRRWLVAKRWVLVTLLAFAIGQFYFLDVLLEMMSVGGISFVTAR